MFLDEDKLEVVLEQLTEPEAVFFEEYLKDLCRSKAARRAKLPNVSANSTRKLFYSTAGKQYLAHLRSERGLETGSDANSTIEELDKIAFGSMEDFVEYKDGEMFLRDWDEVSNPEIIKTLKIRETFDKDGAQTSKTTEITLYDKIAALRLRGQHQGIFDGDAGNKGDNVKKKVIKTVVNIGHRGRSEEIPKD